MPQSLSAVYVHAVFPTKERRKLLQAASFRNDMHSYLAGISKQRNCPPIAVGGVDDHVHLLARLSRTVAIADWIKELKHSSTVWANQTGQLSCSFSWQAGYGAFSVSHSEVACIRHYIEKQEEHHRQFTFQTEFRALLKKHGVEWDEQYLWD
jgi:putative transposase